jgi:hypothetical protein
MTGKLPPLPWTYMITAPANRHPGSGHVYIADANGRKIINLWGDQDEKIRLAEMIIDAAAKLP